MKPHSQGYVTKLEIEIIYLWEFSHNSHRPINQSQNTSENPWNARAHQHSMVAKHLASKLTYLNFFDFTFPFAIAAKKQNPSEIKRMIP